MKRLAYASFLLIILLAINFAPNLSAQSQPVCQLLSTVYDQTGAKWIIQMCPAGTPAPGSTPTVRPTVAPGTTPIATATPTPTGGEPPPTGDADGIWTSVEEVNALPMAGAWSAVLSAAAGTCTPDPSNQDSPCNVTVQAQSLTWARTGEAQYRQKVVDAIGKLNAMCSSIGGRTLALGRELGAYIVAADLIDLRIFAPDVHLNLQACLRLLLTKNLDGMTITQMFERRPNNWGTMGGGTLAALYAYLGDRTGLDRVAFVFRGWAGDPGGHKGFTFGSVGGWGCAPLTGINPVGCVNGGHDLSGALPDDMRRGGAFKIPASPTGYPCGALTGAVAMAWILHRAGYPAFEYGDNAMLRAMQFLQRIDWKCGGDDAGMVATINFVYGTSYDVAGTMPGKNYGWQQWLFQRPTALGDVTPVLQTVRATGETLAGLQDDIAKIQALRPGLLPVGGVYTVTTEDGELYAQDMMNGN